MSFISQVNEAFCVEIINVLFRNEVASTFFTLMHSMWDSTRVQAYSIFSSVVKIAKVLRVRVPNYLSDRKKHRFLQARAFFLASSPRQREADSGSRIIAVIFLCLDKDEEKINYLQEFINIVGSRISLMGDFLLGTVKNTSDTHCSLPLAHGFLQALRLIVESDNLKVTSILRKVFQKMVTTCCRAIELSLVIVADLKDAPAEEESGSLKQCPGTDSKWKDFAKARQKSNTPLNVNTGALGANATFASVTPFDNEEKKMRLIMQRVVMGSWLLIKEACATLSSVLGAFPGQPNEANMKTTGELLISTLTSLKHQGAAFAAHKSLQKLCQICYTQKSADSDTKLMSLPSEWSRRLLHEISSQEIVRDSTLRRSTGYGLGCLSILRSEQSTPRFLFPQVLAQIIRLSLPSLSCIINQEKKWGIALSGGDTFLFKSLILTSHSTCFVKDAEYEWRSRVHALNILRLIILDAPLAVEMRQFVGDAIISALIGYRDTDWAVRNSATMTFSAAMLRVIDADKNAENVEVEREQANGNAITARELFRSYPSLASCLLSMITEETSEMTSIDALHPSLFPILLLISRLQPAVYSSADIDVDKILSRFIDPLLSCLGHVHHKVRMMAARALTVLCSEYGDSKVSVLSYNNILTKCANLLSIVKGIHSDQIDHNLDHGALLGIKYLLYSSANTKISIKEEILHQIQFYASWGNHTCSCPPSCVAIALEVLTFLCIHSDNPKPNKNLKLQLLDTSLKIVDCIQQVSKHHSGDKTIGISTLSSTVATTICTVTFNTIFHTSSVVLKDLRMSLAITEKMLSSKIFDIMLQSAKTFKKGICNGVDNVIQQPVDESIKIIILSGVCKSIMKSLVAILQRDKGDAHPPTLRRLSRCALESLFALKSISKQHSLSDISSISVNTLWNAYVKMFSIGGGEILATSNTSEIAGPGKLSGNAVELLALIVADEQRSEHSTDEGLQQKVNFFCTAVDQATNMSSNWRVHYSAAVGIKESLLLSESRLESVGQQRLKLHLTLLKLLQDNDEDVRQASAKALRSHSHHVTLLAMNSGYTHLCTQFKEEQVLSLMLNQISKCSQGLEPLAKSIIDEYQYSISNVLPSELLNLGMKRKIFEEEDPNPFEEQLVIIHAASKSLVNMLKGTVAMDDLACKIFLGIQTSSKSILSHLKEILTQVDVLDTSHDMTWDRKIFPKLHGLILGSTLAEYFGKHDEELQTAAKELSEVGRSLHPCILNGLVLLSKSLPGDEDTRMGIVENCFLLPEYN